MDCPPPQKVAICREVAVVERFKQESMYGLSAPQKEAICREVAVVERLKQESVGSLSSDVFERRTSTGSEVFSLLTCLDDIKFVFLSFFTVKEAI